MEQNVIKKKPTKFAGWQKLYPDAIKVVAEAPGFLTNEQLIYIAFGANSNAKILQNTSSGQWSSKNGMKCTNRAVISKLAYEENNSLK